jgi:hypothetical protein
VEAAQRQRLCLVEEVSTTVPLDHWLLLETEAAEVLPHYPAPRRYRNGKLGSKHFLGRYGYRHLRTHGEQASSGVADVNVSGSVHYAFGLDESNESCEEQVSETQCSVCGKEFRSVHELQQHCKAQALPDPVIIEDDMKCCETKESEGVVDENAISTSVSPSAIEDVGEPDCCLTVNAATSSSSDSKIDTSDSIFSSVVEDENYGKRLKWYLRHLFGKAAGLSKQQCERMVKSGRVALNGTIVVDSGRFLHTDDTITVLPVPLLQTELHQSLQRQ